VLLDDLKDITLAELDKLLDIAKTLPPPESIPLSDGLPEGFKKMINMTKGTHKSICMDEDVMMIPIDDDADEEATQKLIQSARDMGLYVMDPGPRGAPETSSRKPKNDQTPILPKNDQTPILPKNDQMPILPKNDQTPISPKNDQIPIPPPKPQVLKSCHGCGKLGDKFPRCSKCKNVWYCTAECQKKNWTNHRSECIANHNPNMTSSNVHDVIPLELSKLAQLLSLNDTTKTGVVALIYNSTEQHISSKLVYASKERVHKKFKHVKNMVNPLIYSRYNPGMRTVDITTCDIHSQDELPGLEILRDVISSNDLAAFYRGSAGLGYAMSRDGSGCTIGRCAIDERDYALISC
jgi:hypothetical protein